MDILTLCRIILVAGSIPSALSLQGCNYNRIELVDVEITNMGSIIDQSKTDLDIVEKNGKRVATGFIVFKRDVPFTADIKWEMFSINENNQATKKAEGKKTNFCSYLVDQKPLADMMVSQSNLSSTCPYKKGTYKIYGARPDERFLPCKAPGNSNSWQCKVKITEGPSRKVILELLNTYNLVR